MIVDQITLIEQIKESFYISIPKYSGIATMSIAPDNNDSIDDMGLNLPSSNIS